MSKQASHRHLLIFTNLFVTRSVKWSGLAIFHNVIDFFTMENVAAKENVLPEIDLV